MVESARGQTVPFGAQRHGGDLNAAAEEWFSAAQTATQRAAIFSVCWPFRVEVAERVSVSSRGNHHRQVYCIYLLFCGLLMDGRSEIERLATLLAAQTAPREGLFQRRSGCTFRVMVKLVPVLRGDRYYIRRRVPGRFASVDSRKIVWVCLNTDSREIAGRKAAEVWANLIEAWEAKLAGDTDDAEARFNAARELAQKRGYRYLEAAQVAKLPTDELLRRIESVVDSKGRIDKLEAEAVLGGAKKPVITVTQAFDLFYVDAKERVTGMSPDQLRRHRAARARAVKHWTAVQGDTALNVITTRDLHDFKAWWLDRIIDEDLKRGTANKDFSYLLAMWRAVAQAREIDLAFDTQGLLFRDNEKQATRPPFSTEWLRDKLIPNLGGLNTEARAIALIMVNTGARPSEIAALTPSRIVLEAEVPHVSIEPEDRKLKSLYSDRIVLLVGISLEAAKLCSEGFPTYNDNPGLSNTVNKFLTENGLRESPRHTQYSIRLNWPPFRPDTWA